MISRTSQIVTGVIIPSPTSTIYVPPSILTSTRNTRMRTIVVRLLHPNRLLINSRHLRWVSILHLPPPLHSLQQLYRFLLILQCLLLRCYLPYSKHQSPLPVPRTLVLVPCPHRVQHLRRGRIPMPKSINLLIPLVNSAPPKCSLISFINVSASYNQYAWTVLLQALTGP